MKKRLESELISIAHRVLKLKNNSDVNQLYKETQKLYETLSVLKFYQDNFESVKNLVTQEQLEEKLDAVVSGNLEEETFVENQEKEAVAKETAEDNLPETAETEFETPEPESDSTNEKHEDIRPEQEFEKIEEIKEQPEVEEPKIIENEEEETLEFNSEEVKATEENSESEKQEVQQENETAEEIEEETQPEEETQDFAPHFDLEDDLDSDKKEMPKQISFEDFFGKDYIEPIFVKPNELITKVESHFEEIPSDLNEYNVNHNKEKPKPETKEDKPEEKKAVSLNDKFSAGINIGLNDRIAFVKKLFAGSDEDYNRVISQLNTFDTLQEAEVFIEDMVKPDYNDWSGNDEYEARFIELISKKFV
ncbi:MAG: hypothetical protein ACI9XR_002627 [Flavobacterium sp.]|jgi:hypothetical protein